MDHQAFAQLLGNYGEFVGAIAVVLTLIYLARQIRDSATATKTENAREIFLTTQKQLERDDRLIPWVERYCDGDRDEIVLYGLSVGFTVIFNGYESSWHAMKENSVDRIYCEGIMKRWLKHTFAGQAGIDAWEMIKSDYPKGFTEFIESVISEIPEPMTLQQQKEFLASWRESGVETYF